MSKSSFWDHPIEKLEEALNLKKQIHALQARLGSLFGSEEDEPAVPAPVKTKAPQARGGKRVFSAATRAKMSASQQARRAKLSGAHAEPKTSPARKKKRNLSAEGRARIVAALKARHAAKRAAKK